MVLKGKVLSVMIPNFQAGGNSEVSIEDYIRFLEAAQIPEEEIMDKVKQATQHVREALLNYGFTEEEVDAHLELVIEIEKDGAGKAEVLQERTLIKEVK